MAQVIFFFLMEEKDTFPYLTESTSRLSDALAMQGAKVSVAMVSHKFSCNVPFSAPDGLIYNTTLILGLLPANERRRYFVTTSLIGWVQTENQPCNSPFMHIYTYILIYTINLTWPLRLQMS